MDNDGRENDRLNYATHSPTRKPQFWITQGILRLVLIIIVIADCIIVRDIYVILAQLGKGERISMGASMELFAASLVAVGCCVFGQLILMRQRNSRQQDSEQYHSWHVPFFVTHLIVIAGVWLGTLLLGGA